MGIGPHGSLTVVPPGRHRRVAVAGPGVVPELCGVQQPGPAQQVAAATVGGTGEIRLTAGANLSTTTRREPAKPEARRPKPERNPKPEARIARLDGRSATGRGIVVSDFGLRPSFELRPSVFGFPALRLV